MENYIKALEVQSVPKCKIYDRNSTNIERIELDLHHHSYTKSYIEYVYFNALNQHVIVQVHQKEEKLPKLLISPINEGMPVWTSQTLKENITIFS
jgi:hypothetical protein